MESTNRVEKYFDLTKGQSTEVIKDRMCELEENISNLENEIMARASTQKDASALMEEVKEESLKYDMYKYIIAKRGYEKASDNWKNFEEKFIVNSEQERIFNKMRKSESEFEQINKTLNDEAEQLEKDAAMLKRRLADDCLRLFDYKTVINGAFIITDDLSSQIELYYIKKLYKNLKESILKDRIKLASLNKRLCLMRDFYSRENLENHEQRIFAILKSKIEKEEKNSNT